MDKNKQQREEFLNHMLQEVHKVPVAEVVGSVVDLVPRGRHLLGLCPFHPDNSLGSFVVTPEKNIWTCFAEGIGGSPVKFVMEYDGLSYLQASFKLAKEFAIISEEEYTKYSGKRWDENTVKRIQTRLEEPVKTNQRKANDFVTALVYNAIPEVCGLSEQHKKHLKRVRHLKDSDLGDYFTFPTRHMDLAGKVFKSIAESLAIKNFQKKYAELSEEEKQKINPIMKQVADEIPYVPGFFLNKNNGKIDFVSYKGIGLLARDDRGRAVGIQVRRDALKPGEGRYVWFSSAFAQNQPYTEGGASSGSPGGYIAPKVKLEHPAVCVTEGRFKAEKVAEKGNHAVYVSGVSAWKSVLPIIKRLAKGQRCIYLMFDADMLGNVAVYKQMKALQEALSGMNLKAVLILWSKENGKGFDDLVINKGERYAKYLKTCCYNNFVACYNVAVQSVLKQFKVTDVRELKKDQADTFTHALQKEMEKELKLVA